jgi:hypothetical protein
MKSIVCVLLLAFGGLVAQAQAPQSAPLDPAAELARLRQENQQLRAQMPKPDPVKIYQDAVVTAGPNCRKAGGKQLLVGAINGALVAFCSFNVEGR